MKIKILGVALSLALVCAYFFGERKVDNDVLLFNVEALANGESGIGSCYGSGSIDCPFHWDKAYIAYAR